MMPFRVPPNRVDLSPQGKKPRVYFAGKIQKYCWRHSIVDGLRDHAWSDGYLQQDKFVCVGPFFVSCDHGCYHKDSAHGGGTGCSEDSDIPREEVAKNCISALNQADLVFCYVDSLDCYGTLFELGRANENGIPIVIVFAPGLATPQENQFWFVCTFAAEVYFDVSQPLLSSLLDWVIRRRPW